MATKPKTKIDPAEAGKRAYDAWQEKLRRAPGFAQMYKEVLAQSDLWLQLVEARVDEVISQAQMAERLGIAESDVARMEDEWFENAKLTTILHYIAALGDGYTLDVRLHRAEDVAQSRPHTQSRQIASSHKR